MANIDFPASPAVGQRYAFAGINYIFTAQGVWSISSTGAPATSTSKITVQKFTASGSYVPTPGTQFAIVECVGGGGAGGYCTATAGQYFAGGGGGSGGYSRSTLTAAQLGLSQPITIGAAGAPIGASDGGPGGDTSFGSICIAKGGTGGRASLGSGVQIGSGGAGGVAGTGDIAAAGSPGGGGFYGGGGNDVATAGEGGSSFFGGGAPGIYVQAGPSTGQAASSYGSGGAGGTSANTPSGSNGGAGSSGIVVVTEYNIAAAGPQGPAGPPGGAIGSAPPQGRLSLSSTSATMTASDPGPAACTTLYYHPYVGNRIPIFDGTNMVMQNFASLSCSVTDTVKNPGIIGIGTVNDWYIWDDGGTLRLSHGPAWTDLSTRSAGTLLTKVGGLWVNNAPITNACNAQRGTYVGTTYSGGDGKLYWIESLGDGTGGANYLYVWNAYNRVSVTPIAGDPSGSWSYSGSAFRDSNGNVNGARHTFVSGLAEDGVSASFSQRVDNPGAGYAILGIRKSVGIGSSSAIADYYLFVAGGSNFRVASVDAGYPPFLGQAYIAATETADGTNPVSFNGQNYQQLVLNWRY